MLGGMLNGFSEAIRNAAVVKSHVQALWAVYQKQVSNRIGPTWALLRVAPLGLATGPRGFRPENKHGSL